MKYYVEFQGNKITAKGLVNVDDVMFNEGQKKVSKSIYDALINLPATFETDDEGNIISVTPEPIPETPPPEPTTEEMLLQAYIEIAELKARLEVLESD